MSIIVDEVDYRLENRVTTFHARCDRCGSDSPQGVISSPYGMITQIIGLTTYTSLGAGLHLCVPCREWHSTIPLSESLAEIARMGAALPRGKRLVWA